MKRLKNFGKLISRTSNNTAHWWGKKWKEKTHTLLECDCVYTVYIYLSARPLAECAAVDPLSGQCSVLVKISKLSVFPVVRIWGSV